MGALANFWARLTGVAPAPASATIARHRLELVLVQDRVKLPPAVLDQIREELIAVLSKYVDIDRDGLEVTLTRGEHLDRLVANIPVRRAQQALFTDDE